MCPGTRTNNLVYEKHHLNRGFLRQRQTYIFGILEWVLFSFFETLIQRSIVDGLHVLRRSTITLWTPDRCEIRDVPAESRVKLRAGVDPFWGPYRCRANISKSLVVTRPPNTSRLKRRRRPFTAFRILPIVGSDNNEFLVFISSTQWFNINSSSRPSPPPVQSLSGDFRRVIEILHDAREVDGIIENGGWGGLFWGDGGLSSGWLRTSVAQELKPDARETTTAERIVSARRVEMSGTLRPRVESG